MAFVCNFFKRNFFTPQPVKQSNDLKDDLNDDLNFLNQKPKVLSNSKDNRHPASLFARAVLWEATSWMNPPIEELKCDKGPLFNALKPLCAVGRALARIVRLG